MSQIFTIFVITNALIMIGFKLRILLNVLFITTIIGLAISYLTILLPQIPDLNFLESVGLYCILLPINEFLKSISEGDDEQHR